LSVKGDEGTDPGTRVSGEVDRRVSKHPRVAAKQPKLAGAAGSTSTAQDVMAREMTSQFKNRRCSISVRIRNV
jgi:hypothetical protein